MKYGLSTIIIQKITGVFQQFPAVTEAVLYGSRAKGNYRPSSDIDITLKGQNIDLAMLTGLTLLLDDLLLPLQFDISVYHEIDNQQLIEHIARVGKVIYRSEKQLA